MEPSPVAIRFCTLLLWLFNVLAIVAAVAAVMVVPSLGFMPAIVFEVLAFVGVCYLLASKIKLGVINLAILLACNTVAFLVVSTIQHNNEQRIFHIVDTEFGDK